MVNMFGVERARRRMVEGAREETGAAIMEDCSENSLSFNLNSIGKQ